MSLRATNCAGTEGARGRQMILKNFEGMVFAEQCAALEQAKVAIK